MLNILVLILRLAVFMQIITIMFSLRCAWFLVRNGNNKEAPAIGSKLCGSTVPQTIVGHGNELFVQFYSDLHPRRKGFQIRLKEGKYKTGRYQCVFNL